MRTGLPVVVVGMLSATALLMAAPAAAPVADAARQGDRDVVRVLLQQGADVNTAEGDGMSALHWAADRGDVEMTKMLVYAGANIDSATRIGHYTPLHVASRGGFASVAEALIEAGASVNLMTTNSGVSALHLAAASGSTDTVAVLLDHDADVDARESAWGQTPLIFAAAYNRVGALRLLLEYGADPDITATAVDLLNEEKLFRAAARRQRTVLSSFQAENEGTPTPSQVQAAIKAAREVYLSGEVPEADEEDDRRDRRDPRPPSIDSMGGLTALLHAARQGYIEAVLVLLEGRADINQVSAGDGTSPLLMAIINAQFDLALVLLEHGADPNLAASINGANPLWATINARWQPKTRYPQPQEHERQQATYLDVMKALLEAGSDPNARLTRHPWYMVYSNCGNYNCGLADNEGATAFWRATFGTDVEAMRLLVAYGADVNIPTKAPPRRRERGGNFGRDLGEDSNRPAVAPGGPGLWSATDPGAYGPDPSGLPPVEIGGPGVWPIHAASGVGYGEGFAGNAHRHAPDGWLPTVEYLIELGADVNARDHNGYNALHHAAARGDSELIDYLVKQGADVTAVSRRGQTTADMANGPVQRVSPHPEIVALLESLGSKNNHNCVTC